MNPRPALSTARGAIASAVVAVHDAYEDSPLAVHNLADKLMDAHLERAQTTAMTDPAYAEIQARRPTNSGGRWSGG